MNVRGMLSRVESVAAVDRVAGTLAGGVRRLLSGRGLDRVLRGEWLGHPVHPLLVTVPIGAFVSAAVLDVCGERAAARRLVATGLAATPPTVLAGLADFGELTVEQRRVGVVHAAANAVASVLFVRSYACRRQGRHLAGAAWSTMGLTVLGAGGALGGHLSYALGAGVGRWESTRRQDEAGAVVGAGEHRRLAESPP